MGKVEDITDKIYKLIIEGKFKPNMRIRITHLTYDEQPLVRACYAGRKYFTCEQIPVIDATKPEKEAYSLEIVYLGEERK